MESKRLILVIAWIHLQGKVAVGSPVCPEIKVDECTRQTTSSTGYVIITSKQFEVDFLCDTQTDGGGWIVIQRRLFRDTNFFRNWTEYKEGFGSVCHDYWLGNEYIYQITDKNDYELRIDLVYDSQKFYASYGRFYLDDEELNYRLHIGQFKGNLPDSLLTHNLMAFSTYDQDNDRSTLNCADRFRSGWWFKSCHSTNLNGPYNRVNFTHGIAWDNLPGARPEISFVEMKVREVEKSMAVSVVKLNQYD